MLNGNPIVNISGEWVEVTAKQLEALSVLQNTRKGGCASVQGYSPESNWTVRPVQNIQFLSRVSTTKLYERRMKALAALTLNDVMDQVKQDSKLYGGLTVSELEKVFEDRKQFEISSHQKTLDGVRDDGHRQGHDANYVQVTDGIKINFVTADTMVDGRKVKRPLIGNQGYKMARSIMVAALFLNVKTVKEGKRHVPNSGIPVRMSRAINSTLNKPGLHLKYLSLKEDNFDHLTIDNNVIVPDEMLSLAA